MYTKKWIIEHGVPIVKEYDGSLTLRVINFTKNCKSKKRMRTKNLNGY